VRECTDGHTLHQPSDHSSKLRIHLHSVPLRCASSDLVPDGRDLRGHACPSYVGLVELFLVPDAGVGELHYEGLRCLDPPSHISVYPGGVGGRSYDSALKEGAMDGEREVDQAVVEGLEVKLS
jgi:hypothetical protein